MTRTRVGRRTRYTVNPDCPFRHRAQEGLRVGPVLDLLTEMADADPAGPETTQHQPRGSSVDGEASEPAGPAGEDLRDVPGRWPGRMSRRQARQ